MLLERIPEFPEWRRIPAWHPVYAEHFTPPISPRANSRSRPMNSRVGRRGRVRQHHRDHDAIWRGARGDARGARMGPAAKLRCTPPDGSSRGYRRAGGIIMAAPRASANTSWEMMPGHQLFTLPPPPRAHAAVQAAIAETDKPDGAAGPDRSARASIPPAAGRIRESLAYGAAARGWTRKMSEHRKQRACRRRERSGNEPAVVAILIDVVRRRAGSPHEVGLNDESDDFQWLAPDGLGGLT